MKNSIVQLLLILALVGAAGTVYNLANSKNSEKYLPWDCARFYGELATTVAPPPAPAERPPQTPATTVTPADAAPHGTPPTDAAPHDAAPHDATDEFRKIGLKETIDELDGGTTFVDARRTAEYVAGHIPGAVSICPYEQADLLDKINKLRQDAVLEAPVVVYCTNSNECESSKLIARQLKEAGFLNLMIYSGGFPEWQKSMASRIAKGAEPGKVKP
jgi:rhodanese-related sulfurtransferase